MQGIRFKPKKLAIHEDDPFKEDLLGRKVCAEVLTDFVSSLDEPFVIAIDSAWGTGKTIFLRMWLQHLRNQGFPCLYFNAWESDFSDSPLVSLIGELEGGIDSLRMGEKDHRAAQKILQRTKKIGAALLKSALPTAIKLATSGLLDFSEAKEGDIAKLAEELARKQIEKYSEDKKTISHFREELAKLVQELGKKIEGPNKPVVFIVDELDRCRPTYAIPLLEKIKHLFSVDGLVFVLAIDRRQLSESIRARYGGGFDGEGYLRRFIDLEYYLPEPDHERFAQAQFEKFGLNSALNAKTGETSYDSQHIRELIPKLFSIFGFSLRTQEQCFCQLSVVLRTTPPNFFIFGFLLALLICLRSSNRSLYFDYCKGTATPTEVLNYLEGFPSAAQLLGSRVVSVLEAHLIVGMPDQTAREAAVRACVELAKNEQADLTAGQRAQEVCSNFSWVGRHSEGMAVYLINKIELSQRFIREEAQA